MPRYTVVLALAAAGALGTLARYGLSGLVQRYVRETFPAGTLVVNIVGCLLVGLVMHLVQKHAMLGPEARLVVVTGFLGGFTTFSAFGYETLELLRGGAAFLATVNVAGNVVFGLGAVWLGAALGKWAGF